MIKNTLRNSEKFEFIVKGIQFLLFAIYCTNQSRLNSRIKSFNQN